MRVILVGPVAPHTGGIVHYTAALAIALQAAGTDVEIVTFSRLFPRLLYKGESAAAGASPLDLPASIKVHRLLHYARPVATPALRRVLEGADVVHLQAWTPFLVPAQMAVVRCARSAGIPVVTTFHNLTPHEGMHRALDGLNVRLARRSQAVIVHGDSLAGRAAKKFGMAPNAVHVVPMGSFEAFDAEVRRADARARYGFTDEHRVVLAFGAIREYKGLDVAIRALSSLPPDHRLLVAGKPWVDWAPYAKLIDDLGVGDRVVTRLGYVPDDEIAWLFRAADVAVLPYTQFESQSAAALVGAGFGIPLVASRVGALEDLIQDEFLVPPGDHEALAQGIRRAIEAGESTLRRPAATWMDAAQATNACYVATRRPARA